MLGWGADFPDQTNFMDYHFGLGAGKKFGTRIQDLVDVITKAARAPTTPPASGCTTRPTTCIKQHVPVVAVAHGGSGRPSRPTSRARTASPLRTRSCSVDEAWRPRQLVFMQNAEPLSLYCADETDGESLRACEQIYEVAVRLQDRRHRAGPAPRDGLHAERRFTVWTCKLREGVKFADGSAFDANDVVVSYAAQWDAENPLHKGRTSGFDYWLALFGGFLNPPPVR